MAEMKTPAGLVIGLIVEQDAPAAESGKPRKGVKKPKAEKEQDAPAAESGESQPENDE